MRSTQIMPLRPLLSRIWLGNSRHAVIGALTPSGSGDETTSLTGLHQDLSQLEDRIQALRTALTNLTQLRQVQSQLETASEAEAATRREMVQEMADLQEQVDQLESDLTEQFVSWQQLREPFWQALRFGGLGILVGWALRGFVG